MSEDAVATVSVEFDANAKVAASVVWLDSHVEQGIPANWRELVDLEKLEMREGDLCVLGQIFAEVAEPGGLNGYEWALKKFERRNVELDELGFWLGFEHDDRTAKWSALAEAWKRELTKEKV